MFAQNDKLNFIIIDCSGGSRIFLGAPTPKMRLFLKLFAENCMKMKEFIPRGGGTRVPGASPLDPPMDCKD